MIAADDDRRLQLAAAHHLVEREPGLVALAQAEPADAGRQSLKLDLLRGEVEPALQRLVLREELAHLGVGARDVLRIAGERSPAERPFADAEERSYIRRHEARIVERILESCILRFLADVVAVIDAGNAHFLEADDGAHVVDDGFARRKRNLFRLALAQIFPSLE